MDTRGNTTQAWRFGIFEVDVRNAELRRSGVPIKLREQSFRILVFLLEHAGELVTREELRQVLWPADTFVDFDHSLNTAVMKLRNVLGDLAEAPIYIETIPKRGYRFIAPVSRTADVHDAPPSRTADSVPTQIGGTSEAEIGEKLANGDAAEASMHPPAKIDEVFWAHALDLEEVPDRAGAPEIGGRQARVRRKRLPWWLSLGVGLLAVGIAATVWYLQHAPN